MSDLALLLLITLSLFSFWFKVASVVCVYIYKDPKVAAFLFSLDQFHSLEDMGTLEQIDVPHHTQSSSSSSSSIDSNNHPSRTTPPPPSSPSSSACRNRTDLSTDLRLGLSISPSPQSQPPFNSTPR